MNADRVIADLHALDARSGGERVAWTDVWETERAALVEGVLDELPKVQVRRDGAANVWMTLAGERPGWVIAGSHLDCVPGGGWLDGSLGVLAAVEALRDLAQLPASERAGFTVVDWADEEGARSGRSLFGSSAVSGQLELDRLGSLRTPDGEALEQVLGRHGITAGSLASAADGLAGANAYIELHIEQGPVLEATGRACAAVSGCLGVRRHHVQLAGQAAHAGATPLSLRHDPVIAAGEIVLGVRDAARTAGGLATVGVLSAEPGIPTAVAEAVELVVDARHADLASLAVLERRVIELAADAARTSGCGLELQELWSIDPIDFDPTLVDRVARLTGGPPLVSGPLHDAASACAAGVPTAMIFVRTRGGISHTRAEDADADDLRRGITILGALAAELVQHHGRPA